jgi:hypothetical protein
MGNWLVGWLVGSTKNQETKWKKYGNPIIIHAN